MIKKLLFTLLSLLPLICLADQPNWELIPAESSLTFKATQNNAPVTGQFKSFSAEIKGDLTQPESCNVKITVDINSVFDAYNLIADTLKTSEWFNAKQFPQAVFQSSQFVKIDDKNFEVRGNLTIRDKTLPVTLKFSEEENTGSKKRVKGSTIIKRTSFGIGQGEWADTKAVKDEVQIDFVLTAVKK